MAKGKNSFVLYTDQGKIFDELPDEVAGKLIKLIFDYVRDKDPKTEDLLLKIAFEPIKQTLKRDLSGWRKKVKRLQEGGKKGGINSGESRRNKARLDEASILKPTGGVNVSVNVNDNVNDNVNESKEENALANSNLFRQPNIPTKEQVVEVFARGGGNSEMAVKFYEKYEATGWFLKGSPITNFANLVPSFIKNWKEINEKNGSSGKKSNLGSKSGGFAILTEAQREAGLL